MARWKKKNAKPGWKPIKRRSPGSMKLPNTEPAKADVLQRLRVEYEDHIRQVEGSEPESAGTPLRLFSSEYERLSHEALQVERRTIIRLRNQDVISDEVLRRIQRDIDLAEARLGQHR